MKRVLVLAAVFAAASSPVAAQNTTPGPKPDLEITSFGMSKSADCSYTFQVMVHNKGNASWSGKEPAVVVKDMHPGVLDAWGTGVGIDPPLAPNASKNITVVVQAYAANPAHMTAEAWHPFRASVNDNHVVDESNFNNNIGPGPASYNGIPVIKMSPPNGCPSVKKTQPRAAPPAPTPTLVPIR